MVDQRSYVGVVEIGTFLIPIEEFGLAQEPFNRGPDGNLKGFPINCDIDRFHIRYNTSKKSQLTREKRQALKRDKQQVMKNSQMVISGTDISFIGRRH